MSDEPYLTTVANRRRHRQEPLPVAQKQLKEEDPQWTHVGPLFWFGSLTLLYISIVYDVPRASIHLSCWLVLNMSGAIF